MKAFFAAIEINAVDVSWSSPKIFETTGRGMQKGPDTKNRDLFDGFPFLVPSSYILLFQVFCSSFAPTAECIGVFSHGKSFGADRSSSRTDSPRVPKSKSSLVEVPKYSKVFPSTRSQVQVPKYRSVKVPKCRFLK